jgi:hypothetical protein
MIASTITTFIMVGFTITVGSIIPTGTVGEHTVAAGTSRHCRPV